MVIAVNAKFRQHERQIKLTNMFMQTIVYLISIIKKINKYTALYILSYIFDIF